jgi:hypothetical protein
LVEVTAANQLVRDLIALLKVEAEAKTSWAPVAEVSSWVASAAARRVELWTTLSSSARRRAGARAGRQLLLEGLLPLVNAELRPEPQRSADCCWRRGSPHSRLIVCKDVKRKGA